MKPQRHQRSRKKGSRLPTGVVCVTRPSIFGNPFNPKLCEEYAEGNLHEFLVTAHRWWLMFDEDGMDVADRAKMELKNKSLACWCGLDQACHADNLLDAAACELWRDWCEVDGRLFHFSRAKGGYAVTIHHKPEPVALMNMNAGKNGPIPRRLSNGMTVLGIYRDQQEAVSAGRAT